MRKYLVGLMSVGLIILLWTIYARSIDNPYILPGPISTIEYLSTLLAELETYKTIITTLFRLLIAFTLSLSLAVILGVFAGNKEIVDEFLHPITSMLRSLPIASIIIIIVIIFGNQTSLYIITFLMIFPICYEATKAGVQNIDQSIKDALALEGLAKWKLILFVQLPLALPFIYTAITQSLGLGFKVIVMAEFISQSKSGIGRALKDGSISIDYQAVFAWTFIIIFIVIIFEFILNFIKRKAYLK